LLRRKQLRGSRLIELTPTVKGAVKAQRSAI
jgi:hypothetical protein